MSHNRITACLLRLLSAPCLALLASSSKLGKQKAILTLLQLLLTQIPQLVHLRATARRHALRKLHKPAHRRAAANSILRGNRLDLDQPNPRVLGATVVDAVTQIPDPGLQAFRVVLLDLGAVGLDGGLAADAGPFAGRGEEGQVDVVVEVEVVGFAGLGVGVEDQVDAVALLSDEFTG